MKKLIFIVMLVSVLGLYNSVFAASLTLTKIGTLDTSQATGITHWYYSGLQPTLMGTADPNTSVGVTIDSTSQTITSDATGNWSYTPAAALSAVDHTVAIQAGSQQLSFTLTLGSTGPQETPATAGGTLRTLPKTGNLLPIVGLACISILFVTFGFKMKA